MKLTWNDEELVEHWSLSFDDYQCIENKTDNNKLGFILTLKYLLHFGEFPSTQNNFSSAVIEFVGDELDIPISELKDNLCSEVQFL